MNKLLSMATPFSMLDLASIVEGATAAGALQNTPEFHSAKVLCRFGISRQETSSFTNAGNETDRCAL
jgi:hypothetical protein